MKVKPSPSASSNVRSMDIVSRLEATMLEVEEEIRANDGIYGANRGRLSQRELCRRAGVSHMTLRNASHKLTTLPWVNDWLKSMLTLMVNGGKDVKATVVERINHYKNEFALLATTYNISRLELIDCQAQLATKEAELDGALKHVAELEKKIRKMQSSGKVVPMPPPKGRH